MHLATITAATGKCDFVRTLYGKWAETSHIPFREMCRGHNLAERDTAEATVGGSKESLPGPHTG